METRSQSGRIALLCLRGDILDKLEKLNSDAAHELT